MDTLKKLMEVKVNASFKQRFKFQPYICNIRNNISVMSMNVSNIAILKIKNADYCSIITRTSKSESKNLL